MNKEKQTVMTISRIGFLAVMICLVSLGSSCHTLDQTRTRELADDPAFEDSLEKERVHQETNKVDRPKDVKYGDPLIVPKRYEKTSQQFFPLNLGNDWTYRRTLLGEKGEIHVSIVKKEKGLWVDNQGGRFRHDSYGLRDASRYLLYHPLVEGTKWTSRLAPGVVEYMEIMSDKATLTVPAGVFDNCLIVQAMNVLKDGNLLILETSYAPGVGMVRMETYLKTKKKEKKNQVLVELVKYNIPK